MSQSDRPTSAFSGVLTYAAAHHLGVPHAVGKRVRFDKNSSGTHATNIHLDGRHIGSLIRLGNNGIIEHRSHEEVEAMTDRQLLAAYLIITSPGFRDHCGEELMSRNGRWGTCGCCPRLADGVHPESCAKTGRYDHNIHSTRDGKFYEYDREISRATLVAAITVSTESARAHFNDLRDGHIDRAEFDEHLVQLGLTPASIGETPESVAAAELAGRKTRAYASFEHLKVGHLSRVEFEDYLVQLGLTPADIGETPESVAKAATW